MRNSITPLSTDRQIDNKKTGDVHNTIDQMNLIDICRIFHSTAAEFIFFSSIHRTSSEIDHIRPQHKF